MQEDLVADDAEHLDDLRRAVAQHTRWSRHAIAHLLAALQATDWNAFFDRQEARRVAHLETRRFVCSACDGQFPYTQLHTLDDVPATHGVCCMACAERIRTAYRRHCCLCAQPYWARQIHERSMLCATCSTPERFREQQRMQVQCQRAEDRGNAATLTLPQWLAILDYFRDTCAYCQHPVQAMDHLVPISAGGGTTATNCVPSCPPYKARKGITLAAHVRAAEHITRLQHILTQLFELEGKSEQVNEAVC